jgi:hypothetical protein
MMDDLKVGSRVSSTVVLKVELMGEISVVQLVEILAALTAASKEILKAAYWAVY